MGGFGVTVELPDLAEVEVQALDQAGRNLTEAMTEATGFLKDNLRGQVLEAGMGRRLANTWRGETYPKGRSSLSPAGFVWSKAPKIIDAFSRGAAIRPVQGGKYLWLPTKHVPRKGRNRKMTPDEVDSLFNAEFVIRPSRRKGVLLAMIPVIRAKNNRTWRKATSRRKAQGRSIDLIHMFTLIPEAKMPMRFDLQATAEAAGAFFVRRATV